MNKDKSYLYNLIFSYCVVLVVLFIIYMATYYVMTRTIENEYTKSSNIVLENERDNADNQMLMVTQMANMISANDEMVTNFTAEGTNDFVFSDYKSTQYLRDISSISSAVIEIYVYNPSRNRVMSSSASADAEEYFDTKHKQAKYSYDDWLKLMGGKWSTKLTSISYKRKSSCLAYMTKLKSSSNVLVILIDKSKLINSISKNELFDEGQFSIVDKNNSVLVSLGEDIKQDGLAGMSDGEFKLNGKKYNLRSINSYVTNWKYVIISPQSIYSDSVRTVKIVAVICLIVYLVVGIFLIRLFVKKNYAPLEGLINSLGIKVDKANEFETIKHNIDDMRSECDKLNHALRRVSSRLDSVDEETADEVREKILSTVREYYNLPDPPKDNDLIKKVDAYIREHYTEADLSVNMLGEHFSLSPSYLSRLYKEQTGDGLLSRIHEVRIKHSEELLLAGKSIERTAEAVGYINANSYTRMFKKLRGTTPGQFKRMSKLGN